MNDYELAESLGAHHPVTVSLTVAQAEERERRGLPLPISGDAESDHAMELLRIRQERKARLATAAAPAVKAGAGAEKWPDNVFEVASGQRISMWNPRTETLVLVQKDPATLCEFILEVRDQFGVGLNHRFVIGELDGRVLVEPNHNDSGLVVPGEVDLKVERFIVPESFQEHFLKGRQGIVVHLDGERFVPCKVMQLAHKTSPYVGVPNGAVCDNPKPTEGDLHPSGLPSNKAGHLL